MSSTTCIVTVWATHRCQNMAQLEMRTRTSSDKLLKTKLDRKVKAAIVLSMFDRSGFEVLLIEDRGWSDQPYISEAGVSAETTNRWEHRLPEAATGASSTTTHDTTGIKLNTSEGWETSMSNTHVVSTMPQLEARTINFRGNI